MVGKELIVFVYLLNFIMVSSHYNILSILLDEDLVLGPLKKNLLSDNKVNIVVKRLSKLPFTDQLKSDAWYKLLSYQSVETLDVNQWQLYESIIPNIPTSMLQKVNFTDELILYYFGQQKLTLTQFAQIADEVSAQGDVLANKEKILALGSIFCGFSVSALGNIKESTLRYLLDEGFFQTIRICGFEQLATLARLVVHHTILGPPRSWKPETVKKAGSLIAGLEPRDLREIRYTCFSQISSEVINLTPVETLMAIKNSQLKTLNKSVLLTWRRKTKDFRRLYMKETSGCPAKISFGDVLTITFFANLNIGYNLNINLFLYKYFK